MEHVRQQAREFIADGERWQVVRPSSRKSQPWLLSQLVGEGSPVGLLFVSEAGERRFLKMTVDDFPSKAEFEKLTRIELVELLERAVVSD